MKTTLLAIIATTALTGISGAAWAAPKCTAEPKTSWMSEAAMKDHVSKLGYKNIRTFKTSGICYEIYGMTKDGKKADVYFNPVNGDVVQANIDG